MATLFMLRMKKRINILLLTTERNLYQITEVRIKHFFLECGATLNQDMLQDIKVGQDFQRKIKHPLLARI